MGYAILTATLLLLLQHGREGEALTNNPNFIENVLTGQKISLNIINDARKQVSWWINKTRVVLWDNGDTFVSQQAFPSYDRLSVIGNGALLISNSTKNFSGTYIAIFDDSNGISANWTFQVTVYDPVENVTVTQSPQSVDENMAAVYLTCSTSGDVELVTWTRNGEILGYTSNYDLQDGNKTLQIKNPNRTFSGSYTCNMSNPVSWSKGSWNLTVSYSTGLSGGAIAGIVVGSVLGALLLLLLVVLLVFCIRKRKNGKEKKKAEPQHKDVLRTISGNTLSPDDPAYFTINNIMYRSSSISMGSYIMNNDKSECETPTPKPPASPLKIKHATQV
ncbi:cell adhesion molecule CEACAM7-like [Pyxicephalus adspersus]|uniref:cell adhesion molecule CEACAM7-like n=1 Tax=Pyxicephalus adspersus TaxID=30357 RepID=UPI003B5AD2A7